jgi:hypothetical protein
MRIFLIIFGLIIFAAADNSFTDFSKNSCPLPGDSLVSITDFGASPENDDNTDAFRDAFKAGDNIFIPKGNAAYKIQGKLMIPRGKTLVFEQGGIIDIIGIMNGYDTFIKAGNFQIFTPNSQFSGTFETDTLFCDWLGTVGDGVADDFEAMNSFFNLTERFQFDYLKFGKNKKYYLSSEIERKISKHFMLDGNGSTLIRSYKDITETDNSILSFSGVSRMKKAVNKDLETGSDLITLDNTIGIEDGMGLILYSKELYGIEYIGTKSVHHHYKGLMSKVVKVVDAFTIQIADKIPYHFDAEQIKRLDFYDIIPIKIENLNFSMLEVSGTIKVYELQLKSLFDVQVIGCNFIPNGYTAITASAIYNSLIKNIYIEAPKEGNSNYLGVYGIVPSLNVNVIYDSIYARATTHGIAFTKEPSFGVVVKNSNLKAKIEEANGFDSHSSFQVTIENCEIWGAQGNYGFFEFKNCKMHNSAGASHIWKERQSGAAGRLNVTISDSELSFSENESTNIFYIQSPIDSSNTYRLINCKVTLLNNSEDYTYMVKSPNKLNPQAKIKPINIEGCSFYGSAKLYFPRKSKDTVACINRGKFTFKNNTYSNLIMFQPNDLLFGEWLIEGNKPNNNNSSFKLQVQNADASFVVQNNVLSGEAFNIQNNKGSFVFSTNTISNFGKNIFINNESSVFQNNTYQNSIQIEVDGAKK